MPAHPPANGPSAAASGVAEGARPAWQRQLPNALTLARIGLAMGFFAMLATWRYRGPESWSEYLGVRMDWWLLVAAVCFVVAAATDAADGFLARRWKVVSVFGRVMDPFADKLLVLGAFVFLAGSAFSIQDGRGQHVQVSGLLPWMTVAVFARELLITSLRGVFESRGVSFAATPIGKWKMILQSIYVPLALVLLATCPVFRVGDSEFVLTTAGWAIHVTAWLTVAISVWSGVPYIVRAIKGSHTLSASA